MDRLQAYRDPDKVPHRYGRSGREAFLRRRILSNVHRGRILAPLALMTPDGRRARHSAGAGAFMNTIDHFVDLCSERE